MSLYEILIDQEEQEEKLNWDNISYDVLYQLWGEEHKPDSVIAELFDVPVSRVTKKRREWDINKNTIVWNNLEKAVTTALTTVGRYKDQFLPVDISIKVQRILNELNELTIEEQNAIIAGFSLMKNNPFSRLYSDAEELYRYSTALKQINTGQQDKEVFL